MLHAAGSLPRAPAARRGAAVRRRRRPALVAPAERARHADALLGRPALAARTPSPATSSQTRRRRRCWTKWCPFLEGPPLEPDQAEAYMQPRVVAGDGVALRARDPRHRARSMKYGAHGLPLIGSGDWNDGMNRVGHEGRGESVWLGWFLVTVLNEFAPMCERRGRSDLAQTLSRRGALADRHAGAGLGRRLVSPRLLRRWDAARLGAERGVQARFADAVVGRALGGGAAAPRRARHGRRAGAPGPARRPARAAADAAVRSDAARSRATSRAICPASARTAASTRTPRSGR